MNPKLIQFIELCLVDGVISDKEREVIFRKSKEYGVPEDECEIILEGMIQKLRKKESFDKKLMNSEETQETKQDKSSTNNLESESNHGKKKSNTPSNNTIQNKIEEFHNESISSVTKGEENNTTRRIHKELFEVLQKKNSELREKVELFLSSLNYSKQEKDFLYSEKFEIYKRTYSLSTFRLKSGGSCQGEERNQFSCTYFKDENMNSFHIRYMGEFVKDKLFYEETFWGGEKEVKKRILEIESFYYFPFVDSFENIPIILHQSEHNTFLDLDDFLKCIKNTEKQNSDSIEYKKLEPVLKFIQVTISDFYNSMGKLKKEISYEIDLLDQDKNGYLDVIEGGDDFFQLFKNHQNKIIEVDKNYIQHFIKLSNYLKIKRENLQNIFLNLKDSNELTDMEELLGILKNQIYSYEVVLFHSLNMITSLVEDDLITFYEIYEEFDKLKVFNSDHENEVSQKLSEIGNGLSDLMYQMNSMERNIIGGLNKLSYVTQEGFKDLKYSVTRELKSIDSSIKFNNLLTGIQTYQMYKINKNTKSLSG